MGSCMDRMSCDRAPITNPGPYNTIAQNIHLPQCVVYGMLHTCRTRRIIGPGIKGINCILVYKDLLPKG
jgi:predicted phosphohydrolase